MENGHEAAVELPDDGISKAQLDAIKDPKRVHQLVHAARQVGRYDYPRGILPKAANSNGKVLGTAEGNGTGVEGGPEAERHARRQQTPVFGNEDDVVGGGAAGGGDGGSGGGGAGQGITDEIFKGPPLSIRWGPEVDLRVAARLQCAKALAERAPRLYKRGEKLAIMSFPDVSESIIRPEDKASFEVDPNLKRARLAQAEDLEGQVEDARIQFLGKRAGPKGHGTIWVPVAPPVSPLKQLITDPQQCPARRLLGIACVPYMDGDGILEETHGYNAKTGIYHDLSSLGTLHIPERPTMVHVAAAVRTLLEPFRHYENFAPGNRSEDKARQQRWMGGVSAMALTAVERPFLALAPLLMINGNATGLGKGELCRALAYLAYNVRGDLITKGETDEEFDKRVDSMLIAGAPVMIVDNLNNHLLTNNTLASYATEGHTRIRRFGHKGKDAEVEGRSLFMVNGNNITASEDNARRVLRLDISSDNPNPSSREFPRGISTPSKIMRANRDEVLSAVFTIMRWWRQRGMRLPEGIKQPPIGSFEEWKKRVGNLTYMLTNYQWHPVDAIHANVQVDPRRQSERGAMQALVDRFGLNTEFLSSDVAHICDEVLRARRTGITYSMDEQPLSEALYPEAWRLRQAEEKAQWAYQLLQSKVMEKGIQHIIKGDVPPSDPGEAAVKARLEQLEKEAKEAKEKANVEGRRAHKERDRIDIDLTAALAAVTRMGKLDGQSIGSWFLKVDGKVIGDYKLLRDLERPRVPGVRIIRMLQKEGGVAWRAPGVGPHLYPLKMWKSRVLVYA